MNRLKKISFGKKLYHGTGFEAFKKIAASGAIFPQESQGAGPSLDAKEKDFDGYVFLATSIDKAFNYAHNFSINQSIVVVEVDIAEEALLPDVGDYPGTKKWQDSAIYGEQVQVLGPITDNYFRTIYFYNLYTLTIAFKCPYDKWEEEYEKNKDKLENVGANNENPVYTDNDLVNQLEELGYTISAGLIVNEPIGQYVEILKERGENTPLDCSIYNGSILITVHSLVLQGIIFTYDINQNLINLTYISPLQKIIDEYEQYPNIFDEMKNVFGDAIVKASFAETKIYNSIDEYRQVLDDFNNIPLTAKFKRLMKNIK